MSELMNARAGRNDFHWRLLATVSAAALLASVCADSLAHAADGEPPIWIELGGQFAQQETPQEAFLPPFVLTTPRPPFAVISPQQVEKTSPWSGNGTAKISYEPSGTDWVLSAGILYGRSSRKEGVNQLTPNLTSANGFGGPGSQYIAYEIIKAKNTERHIVLDFQAGKDFGLGMWGKSGKSIVSFGVRYTQFDSRSNATLTSQPTNVNDYFSFHKHYASFNAERKFTGIGPSISWDASADLIGNPSDGGISFDWGLNGAVLFGRQRVEGHHQTTNLLHVHVTPTNGYYQSQDSQVYQHSASPNRGKQVTVPNLGGFAGVSWRYPNAKVSVGYRADFFFGAMDGGIDTAHRENVGFYGPFATVSVGIGG
jgi:hypothetical protein